MSGAAHPLRKSGASGVLDWCLCVLLDHDHSSVDKQLRHGNICNSLHLEPQRRQHPLRGIHLALGIGGFLHD